MGWWRWDLAIEKRMNLPPKINQERLAARLGFGQNKIARAVKIMGVLTPAAREAITRNLENTPKSLENDYLPQITENKGFLITQSILLALADLEDLQKVEAALKVVLEDYLDEPEATMLVEYVYAGNQ